MPKFIHIRSNPGEPRMAVVTLCGRRVDFMSTGLESEATCTQCVAASLARPKVSPVNP